MFPGPYSTGSINLNPPSITTTWYNNQTTFQNPSITTVVANLTASSIVATRTSLCPISPTDFLDGFDIGTLPDACASLIQPYCFPNPDSPSPISTRFPAVCTPKKATATSATTTSPSMAKPSPLTPDTIASCKQYYKILDGDNCYSVANNFKVTLTQVWLLIELCVDITNYDTCSSIHGILMLEPIAESCTWDTMSVFWHSFLLYTRVEETGGWHFKVYNLLHSP